MNEGQSADAEIERLAAGFYRKALWAVITRPLDMSRMPELMADHLKYQIELEQRGILFAAGPLVLPQAEPDGTGLVVIRASDEDAARAVCDADPLHREGVRSYDLYRWTVNEGRMTISISLSDSKYVLD